MVHRSLSYVLSILCSSSSIVAVLAVTYSTFLLYTRYFGHTTATMAPHGFRHLKSFWQRDQRPSGKVSDSEHNDGASRPQTEGMGQNNVRTSQKSTLIYSALETVLIDVDVSE